MAVDVWQTPPPLQVRGGVYVEPVQLPAAHCVPLAYRRQAPLPLQKPSVPQLAAPLSVHWLSGSWPAGTVEQVPPVPDSAHDMQVPRQVVWQQTPCSQNPLAHSVAAAQAPPSGFLPQLCAVQTLPTVQSLPVAQVARQLVPPHTYGAQDWVAPAAQFPAPSQRPASVAVDPVQVGEAQAKPGAYSRQAPAPLQEPSVPQLEGPASAHWFSGSVPAAAGVH